MSDSLFLIKLQVSACNFTKKETLTHVFFCVFCEICKNAFFIEHLRMSASKWVNTQEVFPFHESSSQ